jgi:uncharacterized protein (TIGR02646 family)
MKSIEKDLSKIPESLQSELTNQRRNELIEARAYISEDIYHSRYKTNDVKEALASLYQRKCAFCEQSIESFHVEHFRPKSVYYWLAYSWDNLLLICPLCNSKKGNRFETQQPPAEFQPDALDSIHGLAETYGTQEENLLLHPELDELQHAFGFEESGEIKANNENARAIYTIETCGLNRDVLVEERKRIYDKIMNRIVDRIAEFVSFEKMAALHKLVGLLEEWELELADPTSEFQAFRQAMDLKLQEVRSYVESFLVEHERPQD